ncbi:MULTISPECIES: hypothetical protein [Moraxella]|uniref:Uncharacterized protein n=2 Tax=Bacteria TaxID=2 RepID=A0A3A9RBT8_MORCA|nr:MULTISPECIES: hypothetical protein [Moraxella]AIK00544.1 hypothetical protein DR90_1058 [Moraxella catarrhalis]AIT43247.1 hypothetical protein MC25239_00825 [Moraxella catarrhalis]ARB67636.1 hypothetical protein A6J52_06745 [Moraxella catarrhalis]ARE65995.1 hypothetical protein MC195_04270 [Moraxella catarrhalis]AVL49509.1 hypothetical protein CEP83_00015 [Moraxella catarrhalis]
MAKKRRLGVKYGLDTLLSGTKVSRQVVDVIDDAKMVMADNNQPNDKPQAVSSTAESDTTHQSADDKAVSVLDNLPKYQQKQIALFWQFGLAEP